MPRLPRPTLALATEHGRLLEPLPGAGRWRRCTYQPVQTARAARPVPAVPAGHVDAAGAAAALGWPVDLVRRKVTSNPGQLPAHVVIDGHPFFRTDALPGGAA